jgi:hypothetical protein
LALALLMPAALFAQSPTPAPEDPPPGGFLLALADVNARTGQDISFTCSNPADGNSCAMSNVALNWAWSLDVYPDAGLDCREAGALYIAQTTSAYRYTFTWQAVVYEYRQFAFGGEPPFLCLEGQIRQALLPPNGPPIPAPAGAPTLAATFPAETCPLLPRLAAGGEGRVTPGAANNLRQQPGTGQALVGQIPAGESFKVLGGPVCTGGVNWWQVDYVGQLGWTGEGQADEYWVEPIGGGGDAPTDLVLAVDSPVITAENATGVGFYGLLNGRGPLAWSPGSGYLAITAPRSPDNASQAVWAYDTLSRQPSPQVLATGGLVLDLALSPSSPPRLAILVSTPATSSTSAQIWDLSTGALLWQLPLSNEATALAFNQDGTSLAVAARPVVQLWDTQTGLPAAELPHTDLIPVLGFSPDGTRLYSGQGAALLAWDWVGGSQSGSLPATLNPRGGVLAISPAGDLLAVGAVSAPDLSGAQTYSAQVIDLAGPTQAAQLPTRAPVTALAFDPSGNLLALAQGNGPLQLWELATFSPVAVLAPIMPGQVLDLSFSPDGRFLLVALQQETESQLEIFAVTAAE